MEERTLKHQPHNVMLQVYQEDGDILMNEIVINSNGGKQWYDRWIVNSGYSTEWNNN